MQAGNQLSRRLLRPCREGGREHLSPATWMMTTTIVATDGSDRAIGPAPRDVQPKPDLELRLPARAHNVAVLRHVFAGLGLALGVDEPMLDDIKLAVTEACTNVVVHAYADGEEGPLEVDAALQGRDLTVVVRDFGRGIMPRPESPGLGLGLALIARLADSLEMANGGSGNTEVRMTFHLDASGERT